jgi:protein-tyrosine-phosphatase
MGKIKSVLFVCTGNSCRSVMAEGLLKKYLKEAGKKDIVVRSAGISAMDGMGPTIETTEVMSEAGIDISRFRSKYITDELIKSSDLILVMSGHHMDAIIRRVPQAAPKVHLLKAFGIDCEKKACEDLDISDPIGQSEVVYKNIFDVIDGEIKRIVKLL